jgi:hypothetical protein
LRKSLVSAKLASRQKRSGSRSRIEGERSLNRGGHWESWIGSGGFASGRSVYAYVGSNPTSGIDLEGLWTLPSPGDVVNYWGETSAATGDFVQNYQDMRQAKWIGADKYFHCKANCQAAQHGPGGDDAACTISDTREWVDLNIKGRLLNMKGYTPADSAADQIANRHGRGQGAMSPVGSCVAACSAFRPIGLPSQY